MCARAKLRTSASTSEPNSCRHTAHKAPTIPTCVALHGTKLHQRHCRASPMKGFGQATARAKPALFVTRRLSRVTSYMRSRQVSRGLFNSIWRATLRGGWSVLLAVRKPLLSRCSSLADTAAMDANIASFDCQTDVGTTHSGLHLTCRAFFARDVPRGSRRGAAAECWLAKPIRRGLMLNGAVGCSLPPEVDRDYQRLSALRYPTRGSEIAFRMRPPRVVSCDVTARQSAEHGGGTLNRSLRRWV